MNQHQPINMFMKKYCVLFILLCVTFFVGNAQQFEVKKLANETIELSLRLQNYERITKTVNGINYEDFSGLKSIVMMQKNAPELPQFSESLIVPDYGSFTLQITHDGYVDFTNVDVLPSKGSLKRNINPASIPYEKGVVFNQDSFFPGSLAKIGTPYILRKTRGVTITFYPFQYNPHSKVLRVYQNISVQLIHLPNEIGINERVEDSTFNDEPFSTFYQNHFINAPQYQSLQDQGELLVIYPQSYRNVMEPFIKWKKEKGIPVQLIEINQLGALSSFALKSMIQNQYQTNPNLVYVLLVGDHEQLPTHSYGITGADENLYSDSYYGQLEGYDFYPELLVGRFSGSVLEVETIVNRTLEYEIMPLTGDWMENAIGIGSNEGYGYGDDGEADWQHLRNIKNQLQDFGYNTVYEFYEGAQGGGDSPGNPTSTMIVNALNQGVGLMNYTGHGWTEGVSTGDFTNYSVSQMNNVGKYPFVVSVACNNGTFVSNTSLCESFICAKQGSNITGAIASCGSSILMAWAEPMQTQDEMTNLITQTDDNNRMTTLGGLFFNGQISMLEAYNQSDIAIEVMQTWVFFGDPTTVFRSQSPVALTATHPEIVAIEGGEISLGVNMTGATVTLTQDSLPLFSETIQNNSLYINLGALANDSVIKVTVTKPNTIPYQGEIMVNDPLSLVDFDKGWMIYPNPAREKIHLKNLGGFTEAVNIQLTDCNGRVLVQIPSISLGTDYSIPLPNLQTGLYLLSIENDSLRKTQKIIVK